MPNNDLELIKSVSAKPFTGYIPRFLKQFKDEAKERPLASAPISGLPIAAILYYAVTNEPIVYLVSLGVGIIALFWVCVMTVLSLDRSLQDRLKIEESRNVELLPTPLAVETKPVVTPEMIFRRPRVSTVTFKGNRYFVEGIFDTNPPSNAFLVDLFYKGSVGSPSSVKILASLEFWSEDERLEIVNTGIWLDHIADRIGLRINEAQTLLIGTFHDDVLFGQDFAATPLGMRASSALTPTERIVQQSALTVNITVSVFKPDGTLLNHPQMHTFDLILEPLPTITQIPARSIGGFH